MQQLRRCYERTVDDCICSRQHHWDAHLPHRGCTKLHARQNRCKLPLLFGQRQNAQISTQVLVLFTSMGGLTLLMRWVNISRNRVKFSLAQRFAGPS